jgi:8-oxo-dGTP pyrophosphatase MutT (NUDIX family)
LTKKADKNLWDIPGGRKEDDESFFNAAKREAEEEIGKYPKFKKIGQYIEETKKFKYKVYFCKVENTFSCMLSKEHDDWNWFEINKLPQNLHKKVDGAIVFLKDFLKKNTKEKISDWFTSY